MDTRGRCLVERKASTVNKGLSGRTDSSPLLCGWSAALIVRDKIRRFFINPGASRREQFALTLSLRASPGGGAGRGGAAHRWQVIVSRDVAVHREVVVALWVLVRSVAVGALTL